MDRNFAIVIPAEAGTQGGMRCALRPKAPALALRAVFDFVGVTVAFSK